jgi:hypothetical protein
MLTYDDGSEPGQGSTGAGNSGGAKLSNASATGSAFRLAGGLYGLSVIGSNFGTVTLQVLGADGSTWLTAATAFAANGYATAYLPPGQYRWAVASATAVSTSVVRIPLGRSPSQAPGHRPRPNVRDAPPANGLKEPAGRPLAATGRKPWIRLDFPFTSAPAAIAWPRSLGVRVLAARGLRSVAAVIEPFPCPVSTAEDPKLTKPLKKQRIGEAEIKAAVLNRLKLQGRIDRESTLASEFCLGRTGVRTDLAARSDHLIGVEIKSELDSLRRLPRQLGVYRAHFDCTVLVLATRHLAAVEPLDLAGVEIWACAPDGCLETLQPGCLGPAEEPRWADLMTQVERRRFLGDDGRAAFHTAFDHRFAGKSQEFWRTVGRRKIRADDLAVLSRFRDVRLSQAASADAREAKWAEFAERARQMLEASEAAA